MQYVVTLFAIASLASAKHFDHTYLEEHTAYGYHTRFGIPEAERIRKLEQNIVKSRIVGGVPATISQYPFKVYNHLFYKLYISIYLLIVNIKRNASYI